MEEREKEYITKNLPKLIEQTRCNTILIAILQARKVLSQIDSEYLKAACQNHGDIRQAYELYRILFTRTGAYDILVEALQSQNQSGAAKILEDGKAHQFKLVLARDLHDDPSFKFPAPPAKFRDFIRNKRLPILVISTGDITMTVERVQADVVDCEFFLYTSIESLRSKFAGNLQPGNLFLIAMYDKKRNALKEVLIDLRENASDRKQCIVITTEHQETVREIIKESTLDSQCNVICDNLKWEDLGSDFQTTLLSRIIKFQNQEMTLGNLLTSCSHEEQNKMLDKLETKILVQLINNEKPVFCRNTLQSRPKPHFYIQRKIISRSLAISRKILEDGKSDESTSFVITGMSRFELTSLKAGGVSNSEAQIRPTCATTQSQSITAKFIILDKSEHFPALCNRIKNKKKQANSVVKNLHWFKWNNEGGHLEWVKSFGEEGSLSLVQQHIINLAATPGQREKHALAEQQLVSELTQECNFSKRPAICISDNPGMGKTTLMAHIGDELLKNLAKDQQSQQQKPLKFIQYFVISELMKDLEELGIREEESLSKKVILDILMTRMTETELVRLLFQRKGTKCELMLDGFDEVLPHQAKLALKFISMIRYEFIPSSRNATAADGPVFRIWLTTRSILLQLVEQTLGVLGYNMLPFDQTDQQTFLERYWTQEATRKNINLDPRKLREFSDGSLKLMERASRKMSQFEVEMTGIPLQCLLLAQICEGSVNYECSVKNEETDDGDHHEVWHLEEEDSEKLEIRNMADLYRLVMEKKLEIFLNRESTNSHLESHLSQNNKQIMKRIHMKVALELLFPEWLKEFEIVFLHESFITPEELSIYGFVTEYTKNHPVFVHRTYAEYFVALFAVEIGTCERLTQGFRITDPLSRFFLDGLLVTTPEIEVQPSHKDFPRLAAFQTPVVTYFIDELLEMKMAQEPIPLCLLDSIQSNLGEVQLGTAEPFQMTSSKLFACISNDRPNIATMLISSMNDTLRGIWLQRSSDKHTEMVYAMALRGNKVGLEMICNLLEKWEDQKVSMLTYDHTKNPVVAAVLNRDLESVEYLVQNKGFKPETWARPEQKILHKCVRDTLDHNNRTIENLRNIIICLVGSQDLVANSSGILEHMDSFDRTPLIEENVHVKLRMTLIEAGADVNAYDENGSFVLHMLGDFDSITPESYHELLELIEGRVTENGMPVYLQNNTGYSGFCTPKNWDWHDDSPLHLAVAHFEVLDPTLELFKKYGFDFNTKNSDDYNLIHVAVKFGRSIRLIDKLDGLGALWYDVNIEGKNAIHEAAWAGHVDFLRWIFLKYEDVRLNAQDNNERTAMHYAMRGPLESRQEVVSILMDNGWDINMVNNEDDTPLTQSLYHKHGLTVQFLEYLKINGANILGVDPEDKSNVISALFFAADTKMNKEFDMTSVARYLIREGANLNLENSYLVHTAAENGWLKGLELLAEVVGKEEFRRIVITRDKKGRTPICAAIQGSGDDKLKVLKFLIGKAGRDVVHKSCGKGGVRPLHVCAYVGWLEGMKVLLNEYKVDILERDNDGNTALHWGHCTTGLISEVVEFLVQKIGEEDARELRNFNGNTPEEYGRIGAELEREFYTDLWG